MTSARDAACVARGLPRRDSSFAGAKTSGGVRALAFSLHCSAAVSVVPSRCALA